MTNVACPSPGVRRVLGCCVLALPLSGESGFLVHAIVRFGFTQKAIQFNRLQLAQLQPVRP